MPNPSDSSEITKLLMHAGANDSQTEASTEQIYQIIYPHLRNIAGRMMRSESERHTLQPTALVNEAYLRLVGQNSDDWRSRAHFYAIAARVMRRVLIDHARAKNRIKRGGDWQRVTMHSQIPGSGMDNILDVISLDDALSRLEKLDERVAKVVELKIFSGLAMREVAHVLNISKRTVDTDWAFAIRWLAVELSQSDD